MRLDVLITVVAIAVAVGLGMRKWVRRTREQRAQRELARAARRWSKSHA